MASKRDYYEILGVPKGADAAAIKAAYKKLAIKFHPDKNPGDKQAEDKFKEASEAYGVLSEPEKKAQYDRFGHEGLNMGAGGPQGFSNFEDIFSAFGDVFGGDFFGRSGGGGRRGRSGPPRGQDLQIALNLTLKDISTGVAKKIRLRRYNKCAPCDGAGGTGKKTCGVCGGAGQVRQVQSSFFGQVVNVTACPECGGLGQQIQSRCTTCSGEGRTLEEVTITVDIPAGVEEGQYLTLRGEGHRGQRGGASGDLLVAIREEKDAFFERRGVDLHCSVEVPFPTVALGGDIRVPTLDGDVDLKVPAGTQSEKLMRLRGKGLPELNAGNRGHLYVKVHVQTPEKLGSREAELLRELQRIWEGHNNGEPKERSKSFFF